MILTEKTRRLFLIIYVLAGFLWGLENTPLFDEDEGFFAEGTREMVARNDFVSSFVNQEQRFDKPPLTNWLQYASAQVFGWNEFAIRLPSALAAILWMLIIYLFTKHRLGERVAFFATLIAASSLQITIVGKAALADSLLNASVTGAMFCLYEAFWNHNRKFLWVFYTFTAIGFMAKGPIAILIPGAVFLIYLIRWKTWKPLLKIFDPVGLGIFLVIAVPWYILEYQRAGMDFINGFFFRHNVNRFQTAFEGHYGGILYFVPILVLGLLPFTAIILKSFGKIRFIWSDKLLSFLFIWFGLVFVLFSLSGTKLHHYIIYGYSPLCMIGGWYATKTHKLPVAWPSFILLGWLALIPFMVGLAIPEITNAYAVDVIRVVPEIFDAQYAVIMCLLVGLLLIIWIKKDWQAEIRMGLTGIVLLITVNILWMPRLGTLLQLPVKEAALIVKKRGDKNLVVLDHYNPSFHFYSGLYAQERKPKAGDIVFGRKAGLSHYDFQEIIFEKHGIVLVKIRKKKQEETGH
ncbi:Undecaprenyl phosphate-alpha-4-amino-4-deoxy-L-arabinose arabinosyl transferase [Dyadobacter sp. CECT 9275]|uniref:Undecaprenyl phosphate-alpha-4-amino-4-deoxy-L-arabinose arabinosyl transferase n=1 Tax=Dyadobacter helix TaxID=2822344 RepID=A0A916JIU8_9BACT|nr:glycosyltransferase family 39 protein [Dyadobacter sp. CECT 9275]CAG5011463.1 Undecaprenyl phosphate-alpha-4-amino-4-deoxy-L-arabinose arabinosyl transferase [Dyadobacter sp. CECT 9275]